jgi:uncharacterized DUF497 family protein
MEFEWDPAKNGINESKHGISFLDALAIFDDPHHVVESVTRLEHGEFRFKAVGMLDDRYYTVIFTDRIEIRRIISVRRARTNERRKYDQGKKDR